MDVNDLITTTIGQQRATITWAKQQRTEEMNRCSNERFRELNQVVSIEESRLDGMLLLARALGWEEPSAIGR